MDSLSAFFISPSCPLSGHNLRWSSLPSFLRLRDFTDQIQARAGSDLLPAHQARICVSTLCPQAPNPDTQAWSSAPMPPHTPTCLHLPLCCSQAPHHCQELFVLPLNILLSQCYEYGPEEICLIWTTYKVVLF